MINSLRLFNAPAFGTPSLIKRGAGGVGLTILLTFISGCGGTETAEKIQMSGNIVLTEKHGGKGAAWGSSTCESCHPLAVIHANATEAIRDAVKTNGYDTCMGCHGDNGTGNERHCTVCHNETDMPDLPKQSGDYAHTFITGSVGNISDEACLSCHPSTDMDGYFDINIDLAELADSDGNYTTYDSVNDFCTRCHSGHHHHHTCTHCHSIHGANSSGLSSMGMGGMGGM